MIRAQSLTIGSAWRHPAVALCCYALVILTFIFVTWAALADIFERQAAIKAAAHLLDQIEGRRNPPGARGPTAGAVPAGSPFLEGQTVTVAGAAILQRASSAVTRFGGNVLSSQVDVGNAQTKRGLVSVLLSCELDQPQLQQLLYDLEAGMPFLFVDQLVVQAPQGFTGTDGGRLRVLLGISGHWEGAK